MLHHATLRYDILCYDMIRLTETILHHFACMHTMHTPHACIHTIHTHAKTSDTLAKSSPDHSAKRPPAPPEAGLLWSGLDFARASLVFACVRARVCIVCMLACGVCMVCMHAYACLYMHAYISMHIHACIHNSEKNIKITLDRHGTA